MGGVEKALWELHVKGYFHTCEVMIVIKFNKQGDVVSLFCAFLWTHTCLIDSQTLQMNYPHSHLLMFAYFVIRLGIMGDDQTGQRLLLSSGYYNRVIKTELMMIHLTWNCYFM